MAKEYLVKNTDSGVALSNSIIKNQGYKCTPKQEQDEDSYRDGSGKLHRNILSHKPSKLVIATHQLDVHRKQHFRQVFPSNTLVNLEYYSTDDDLYHVGVFYIPSYEWVIDTIDKYTGEVTYLGVEFTLIEY